MTRKSEAKSHMNGALSRAMLVGIALFPVGCKEKDRTPSADAAPNPPSISVPSGVPTIPSVPAAVNFEIDAPDDVQFARGIFLKPGMDADENDVRMAPLFVCELNVKSPVEFLGGIGNADGSLSESPGPTVYLFEDFLEIDGVAYHRSAHLWAYSDAKSDGTADGTALGCVQVISNRESMPVLWHVFDSEPANLDVVYIAQSVEQAAKREHGAPLRGRRFAVETWVESSQVRVGRLIEDGPEAMGPMVYISHSPHRVAALSCRCMDSQVKAIEDARFYRLMRMTAGDEASGSIAEQIQNFLESNGIKFNARMDGYLSRDVHKHLRLPSAL